MLLYHANSLRGVQEIGLGSVEALILFTARFNKRPIERRMPEKEWETLRSGHFVVRYATLLRTVLASCN